jgi:hypothetical protein
MLVVSAHAGYMITIHRVFVHQLQALSIRIHTPPTYFCVGVGKRREGIGSGPEEGRDREWSRGGKG